MKKATNSRNEVMMQYITLELICDKFYLVISTFYFAMRVYSGVGWHWLDWRHCWGWFVLGEKQQLLGED
jgi:hypothetical protein